MSKKADRKKLAAKLKALEEDNFRIRVAADKLLKAAEEKALELEKKIEEGSKEIDAAVRRGDLQNGAANDIRNALGLETKV